MFYYSDLMHYFALFVFTMNPNTEKISAYTVQEYVSKYGNFSCNSGGVMSLKIEGKNDCTDLIKLQVESATFTPKAQAKVKAILAVTENPWIAKLRPLMAKGHFVLVNSVLEDMAVYKPGKGSCKGDAVVYATGCMSLNAFLNNDGVVRTPTHVYFGAKELTHMQYYD